MPLIGLMSDSHGFVHPKIYDFFSTCDEIWHAGDIGDIETADELAGFKKLRAVHGNIDDMIVRGSYPKIQLFTYQSVKVLMTHIGGYPGRYEPEIRMLIEKEKPDLFISGHSHILKVIYDQKHGLLHMNPGASGRTGIHKVVTFLRFVIDGKDIKDLEIFETERTGQQLRY